MKTQTFLKGSFILFFSALITKALGALFKIPLTMLLGGVGMGYFGCAYGLFLPIYALSITGLSTAVASLVAKEHGAGQIQNVRKIRRTARLLFAGVGLLLSGFIWLFAVPFARSTAADASAAYAIRMMAPAAFFGCLAAVERGYYEGLCNMYPTAVSQAVESIAKVACGLLFSHYVFTHETQVLAYFPAGTPILPIAAAAAVLGVTLSTACGVLYFFFRNLGGDGLPKAVSSSASLSIGSLMRSLFQIMLPVALGSFVTNLTSLIDLCTMMRCFDHLQQTQAAALFQKFGAVAAESTFPALVYGAFSGMALTVFNLVPSVTNMFGKSVLPCAAQSWAKGQKEAVQKQLQSVLFLTALIALPAAGGLFCLSDSILTLLYPGQETACRHCCGIAAVTAAGHGVSLLYHAIIQHFTGHWQSRFARQIYAALRCRQAAGKLALPANSGVFPLGGWAVNQSLLCSAVRHDAFLPLSDAGDVPPWIKAHSSTVLCSDNEHHDCVSVPKSNSNNAVARYAAVQRWQCSRDVWGCTIVAGKDGKPPARGALFPDGLRLARSSPVAEFCFLLLFSYIHLICQLTAFQNYDIIYGM